MQPLMHELASSYVQRQKHVDFEFSSVGSTAGIEALRRGIADVALVSTWLDSADLAKAEGGKEALLSTAVGRDAVAIIVNARNPLAGISSYQLRAIYEGSVSSWQQLDPAQAEEAIVVVSREDGSGTRATFEAQAMRGHRVTPTSVVMPGSEAVRDYVASHEGAIGYLSIGWLSPGIKAITIDGQEPGQPSFQSGTYPLTRPFNLVYRSTSNSEILAFVHFVSSPAGQSIVKRRYGGSAGGSSELD